MTSMPTFEETDGVDVGDGVIMLPERSPAPHVQPVGPRQPLPPQWTYRIPNRSETPLVGQEIHGGKPLIRFETYGSAVNTPVDQAYFERLQPRGWLTNHLVDLYLSEVTNTYFEAGDVGRLKELCLLPTSAFYTIQETKGRWLPHTQLDKWDSALDHTFVAFPLNAHRNHWLLGILTYASDLLQEHNSAGPIRTSVVVLNSISSHNPSNLEQRVRQMIKVLAIGKALRQDGIKTLKFFYPLVPQQPNDVDCGLYPGHFLSVFLTDPSRFADHCTGEKKIAGLVGEIWKASLIPTARETLRELAESVAVIRKASLLFHSGRTPSDLKMGTKHLFSSLSPLCVLNAMPKLPSPIKKSRRGKRLPLTAYIPGQTTGQEEDPVGGSSSSSPLVSPSTKGKRWWQPQDVFLGEFDFGMDLEHSEQREDNQPEDSFITAIGGESFTEDVGGALDEAAITAQLASSSLDSEPEDEDDATQQQEQQKSFLRAHYLPFLLAAKAPPTEISCCSNGECTTTYDPNSTGLQMWRCATCFGGKVICTGCLRNSHREMPFHVVEAWVTKARAVEKAAEHWSGLFPKGFGFFERRSLKDAGLQVGLGHGGDLCPRTSIRDNFDMNILHVTGQHSTTFRPCACNGKDRWKLLLEHRIFPATEFAPQTGFTFELLDHHQTFDLRAKSTLREYYRATVDLMNGADPKGDRRVSNIYDQLRIAVRQYRVLIMYMRAGRFDAEAPVEPGELCVGCPACPQPGINLPENWNSDPLRQLRYSRFLSGDGNFKLQKVAKRKSIKYDPRVYDSMLGDGAFWAKNTTFYNYIKNTSPAIDEPAGTRSACNTMAGDPGLTPEGANAVEITGIFAVSCRHIFLCKNGVVDFHHGERFRLVDVSFSGPLNESYASGIRYFVITYDIACKYGINFSKRCFNDNPSVALVPTPDGQMHIMFCVNKFHQESHEEDCSAKNALNYTKFVGRTCGEGVETIWASMNWLRYSTREMTTGSREETLSEHFNDWNWQKLMGIVDFLRRSYLNAIQYLTSVKTRFNNIKFSLGEEAVSALEIEYQETGGEQFLENRDELKWPSRKELVKQMEDLSAPATGRRVKSKNVSYVDLVCKALKLEEMQAKLRQRAHDASRMLSSSSQLRAQIADIRKKLEEGLTRHYSLLLDVAPQFRESGRHLSPDLDAPHNDEILLPSRLSKEQVEALGLEDLLQVEVQLRVGHAYDCLRALKRALALRSFWTRHTKAQQSSQNKKTKGQASLQASRARVKEASRAYSACYNWLVKCAPDVASQFGLRPLGREDLMLLSEYLEEQHYRQHGSQLPWIWNVQPNPDAMDVEQEAEPQNPSGLEEVIDSWKNEFVRLEYVHAHAAFDRWGEEVGLLRVEMPATVRWFENRALTWSQRVESDGEDSPGYKAYASKQFSLYVHLAEYARQTFTQVVGGPENWDALMEVGQVEESSDMGECEEEVDVGDEIFS